MSNISEMYRHRRMLILICILIAGIIVAGVYSKVYEYNNIVKIPIKVCVNSDTEAIFEEQFEGKNDFKRYYEYETTANSKDADFVFTSDVNQINTSNEYTVEGYSPLIICLKNSENAKNYLKTNTKNGFLTCNDDAKKIKSTSQDSIICDFARVIDVILNNGDWSDLGGEDKKITVYCPAENTVEGELFYKFLLITLNDGKYPENNLEEIEMKAKEFLNSSNTIQTDVSSKLSKLGTEVKEEDIYILFESDFLNAADEKAEILVTYPELTVIKQIYLQFNNLDIQEDITDAFDSTSFFTSNERSLTFELRFDEYRNSEYPDLRDSYGDRTTSFNVQDGFNYYELSN